ASYEPIDVSRFIDIAPDELSGTVKGNVKADIPLTRDVVPKTVDWNVALSYEDLAIARPVEGQKVREATGKIVVNPGKAVIAANARLNDLPAMLHLVDPQGSNKDARVRRISADMDDKARYAI